MLEKDSLSSVVDLGVIISQLSASVFGREDSLWSLARDVEKSFLQV